MVVHRDKIGKYLTRLEMELRKLMEPNSAMKLKVLKRNNLKDFIVNGAALGVSHLLVITRTEQSVMLRIIRCPQGPTLTFRIHSYTLGRHIVSSQKHPLHFQQQYEHSPLIIMNGFNDVNKKHLKLVQSMFQSMFPPIAVDTVSFKVYSHLVFAIKTVPTGISKSAKKLLQSKIPDLSKYRDISEFILNPGQLSESEFEGEQKEVELAQDLSTRGCRKGQKTNIRLIELGPRITFSLVKIVDGVNDGEVLYHAYIVKTPKEIQELRERAPLAKKARGKRLLAEEHRIIRKLTNIAAKKKEEMEAEQREKDRLIEKQRAVTGEESNEDRSGNVRSLKRKKYDLFVVIDD
uniref:Brix domain-containing protein n=1 Tax=Syphacia muris TaxID=451379 RepID=A0A0N5AFN7_9BILA